MGETRTDTAQHVGPMDVTVNEDDGRMNLWLNVEPGTTLALPSPSSSLPLSSPGSVSADSQREAKVGTDCPPLNIVIFIVGSRGDVQPYIALAVRLIQKRGHRVRIATHGEFKDLVLQANERLEGIDDRGRPLAGRLEFFNVGGNPKELMAYMVKNPGLLPGWDSIKQGDVGSKRRMAREYLQGFADAATGPDQQTWKPFAADAIISNPPAFAHIHIAESLGLPLVLSFTMPWTATSAYAHPLVNVQRSDAEPGVTNYLSYVLADTMVWQGLGDVINKFRTNVLGLLPLSPSTGPMLCDRLKVPVTYAWSEALLPKPADWRDHIDIVGFYTLPALKEYKPDPNLVRFLGAGPPPVYIGFGSVVVADPDKLTQTILEAVQATGVRALVSAGWADLGGEQLPDSIFLIKGDVSHEWLFADGRVAAVCHHGGAGTTAVGLKHGRPTIIVPFFGDQRFWGESVNRAGAGPPPIPYKELNGTVLAEAIQFALSPGAAAAAAVLGQRIRSENAEDAGVKSFHRHIPLKNMRCELDRTRNGPWWCEKYCIRLSAPAAALLVQKGKLSWDDIAPHRPIEYATDRHYADPLAASGQSIYDMFSLTAASTGQMFYAPHRGLKGLLYDVPKASLQVIGTLHEGVQNVPGLMGSAVRTTPRITSFRMGMAEGGKSFTFGLWDGVTGLVTEPVRGALEEGPVGFAKGVGRGLVNLIARPAAGVLSLAVLPSRGAYMGTKRRLSKREPAGNLLKPGRQADSEAELQALTEEEKAHILERWEAVSNGGAVRARKAGVERRRREQEAALLSTPKAKPRPAIAAGSPRVVHAPPFSGASSATMSPGTETESYLFASSRSSAGAAPGAPSRNSTGSYPIAPVRSSTGGSAPSRNSTGAVPSIPSRSSTGAVPNGLPPALPPRRDTASAPVTPLADDPPPEYRPPLPEKD